MIREAVSRQQTILVLIALKSIYKIYNVGGEEVRALDGIDLDIKENE